MVLRYMVSDTDLAEGKIAHPPGHVVQPEEKVTQPKTSVSSPGQKRARFWLSFATSVIVLTVLYYFWAAEWRMVRGIIYNADNPSAIVYGQLVREGEMVDGYKVVKIYRDRVILEKDGKHLTKWVH